MLQALQIIQNYDYVLIDTRGAYGVLVENAVLAVNICLSPLPPETLPRRNSCVARNAWWKVYNHLPHSALHLDFCMWFSIDTTERWMRTWCDRISLLQSTKKKSGFSRQSYRTGSFIAKRRRCRFRFASWNLNDVVESAQKRLWKNLWRNNGEKPNKICTKYLTLNQLVWGWNHWQPNQDTSGRRN